MNLTNIRKGCKKFIADNRVIFIYAAVITSFVLILNRLFIKMDDGNFLGIAMSPEFTYLGFLKNRYLTVSGRTIGEFLLMFFIRHNQIFYKLLNAAFIVYIAWFWTRLSDCFRNKYGLSAERRHIICCAGLFLMIVSCLNPAVFWYAGSFSYLWPFAGILITIYPIVFYFLEGKTTNLSIIAAILFAPLSAAQEQSCAAIITLYSAMLIITLISHQVKFKPVFILPFTVSLLCSIWMFSAPGIHGRSEMEAASGFTRYTTMRVSEKLLAGLSVFYTNTMYMSFVLFIIFAALLSYALYIEYEKTEGIKKLLAECNAFIITNSIMINLGIIVITKKLPHIIVRETFVSGEYGSYFWILIFFSTLSLLIVISLLTVLIIKNKRLGLFVLLCCTLAFGCALAMSFSSSIFASGQRVFFYTNAFLITACIGLISTLPKGKTVNKIYACICIYSAITFIIDIFAFTFVELPLMG